MTWGGSGPFLFDGAAVEVGFLPIESVSGTAAVTDVIDYVITFRRRRR